MSAPETGLSAQEAATRLALWGENRLLPPPPPRLLRDVGELLRDPAFLLLLSLSGAYLLLGERHDAIVLAIAAIPVAAVDVVMNLRADRALHLLRAGIPAQCRVIRDGADAMIRIEEVVPGDVILLAEGDAIPADGTLSEAEGLAVNEAALTGESLPVMKSMDEIVFAGTNVLAGRGTFSVNLTGARTRIGLTALSLGSVEAPRSPLRAALQGTLQRLFLAALLLSALLFFIERARGTSFAQSLIAALTLAMSSVPEEFPVVVTLLLSVAGLRLSRRGVLVRSMPAIETVGRVKILCTDKTGTLTQGRFKLVRVIPFGATLPDRELHAELRAACEPHVTDLLERAILEWLENETGESFEHPPDGWTLVRDHAFDPSCRRMSHAWKEDSRAELIIAAKGAWEGVRPLCRDEKTVLANAERQVSEATAEGSRVIALASKRLRDEKTGPSKSSRPRADDESNLNLRAILVFSDPIRDSVPAAVKSAREEDIEIVLMSGDHPLTVISVAARAGICEGGETPPVCTGSELDALPPRSRRQRISDCRIFARIEPRHKQEIVEVKKAGGRVVAVTGDGINDLPALKAADVGISMGETATEAARSTAKIVLYREDFTGLIDAIREGRSVFRGIAASFAFLISFHVPLISLSVLGPLCLYRAIFQPIHLVVFHFLIHPLAGFAFIEPEGARHHRPRLTHAFLTRTELLAALGRGIILTTACLTPFFLELRPDASPESQSSASVLILLFASAFSMLMPAADAPARRTRLPAAAGIVAMTLILYGTSTTRELFHLEFPDWRTAAAVGVVSAAAALISGLIRSRSQ